MDLFNTRTKLYTVTGEDVIIFQTTTWLGVKPLDPVVSMNIFPLTSLDFVVLLSQARLQTC